MSMPDIAENVLNGLNIYIGAKDHHSRYIFCNENMAKAANLDSPGQVVGKTDFDLGWHEQAEFYQLGDRRVLNTRYVQINHPEIQTQPCGIAKILCSKNRIFDRYNRCIGLMGSYIDVSDFFIQKKAPDFYLNKTRFYLGKQFNHEYLTKREVEVFQKILLGYSSKQAATVLNISARTVETHLNRIKRKLQCYTRGDLIVTAMKTGLTYSVLDVNAWQ